MIPATDGSNFSSAGQLLADQVSSETEDERKKRLQQQLQQKMLPGVTSAFTGASAAGALLFGLKG
jgi:hypothetical protein